MKGVKDVYVCKELSGVEKQEYVGREPRDCKSIEV